jgi:hypothetical protein
MLSKSQQSTALSYTACHQEGMQPADTQAFGIDRQIPEKHASVPDRSHPTLQRTSLVAKEAGELVVESSDY